MNKTEFCVKIGIALLVWLSLNNLGSLLAPVPEPESCSLCSGRPYHAPCIVNLSTGEVGELQVYDPDPRTISEIAAQQQTGTFSFLHCAGLTGWRETDNHTSQVTVPRKRDRISQRYFCENCRSLLMETAVRGYILLDLYDLEQIQTYSILDGAHYIIRDYSVDICGTEEPDGLLIKVTGNLFLTSDNIQ